MNRSSQSWESLFAGIGLSLLALDGSAEAADANLPLKAPPIQAAFDWSGLYIGAHAGYGRGPAVRFSPIPS